MSTQPAENRELVDEIQEFLRVYYQEKLLELANKYPNEKRSIRVDWMDLYKFDPDIADDYCTEPREMKEYLNEALRTYDLPVQVKLSKAQLRVHNVPDTRTYSVGGYRSDNIGEYIAIEGQVAKTSEVKPKPETLAYGCLRCETVTRVPQQGSSIQEPHECKGCERQGPFEVRQSQSEFRDFQLVRVQQPPEQTKGGQGAEVDVRLEDDLVKEVQPGDRVEVAGTMALEDPSDGDLTFDPYIDGNGVNIEETDYDEINVDEHLEKIQAIANGEHGDPFELLIKSIAPKIEGYNQIKEAIALQMFGGVRVEYPDGSFDRGDSHILLLGDPGTAKSSLLRAVEQIAPRSTYASGKGASAAGMTASAVRDDFGNQEWSLEAGALVLAHKGTACVDEIDKIDDDAVSSLHDALESQRVNVNKAGINAEMPAETALLAAGNPKYGRFEQHESIAEQIDLGPTLMSRFDLMFMLDDSPDEQQDKEIIEGMVTSRQTAAEYTAQPNQMDEDDLAEVSPAINHDVLRAYIAHAKQEITPRIQDPEVEQSLIDSYARLRLINGENGDVAVPVTFRKLEGIMRLAEASARIRLSDEVTEEDIDRAKRLVMKSMRDVGMDGEDGKLDADVVETGTSKAQRDRMHELVKIVSNLQTEHDKGAPKKKVLEAAMAEDMGRSASEHEIKKLKQGGDLYEPQKGYLRTS